MAPSCFSLAVAALQVVPMAYYTHLSQSNPLTSTTPILSQTDYGSSSMADTSGTIGARQSHSYLSSGDAYGSLSGRSYADYYNSYQPPASSTYSSRSYRRRKKSGNRQGGTKFSAATVTSSYGYGGYGGSSGYSRGGEVPATTSYSSATEDPYSSATYYDTSYSRSMKGVLRGNSYRVDAEPSSVVNEFPAPIGTISGSRRITSDDSNAETHASTSRSRRVTSRSVSFAPLPSDLSSNSDASMEPATLIAKQEGVDTELLKRFTPGSSFDLDIYLFPVDEGIPRIAKAKINVYIDESEYDLYHEADTKIYDPSRKTFIDWPLGFHNFFAAEEGGTISVLGSSHRLRAPSNECFRVLSGGKIDCSQWCGDIIACKSIRGRLFDDVSSDDLREVVSFIGGNQVTYSPYAIGTL